MPNTDGRTRARLAVAAELSARGWNAARLAAESTADPGTIGDFLNGKRWIKLPTQGKIEAALEWPHGRISTLEAGTYTPEQSTPATPVGAGVDPEVLADLQELSPQEVQRVRDFVRGIRSRG